MKNLKKTLIVVGLLMSLGSLQAQRFGAAIIGGFNMSQMNGDDTPGYDKLGLQAGIEGIINLQEKMDISIGIQYSQRGSRNKTQALNPFKYKLRYIEVPVRFNFSDWADTEDGVDYYRLKFSGGLSYGNLLSVILEDTKHDGLENEFRNFDLSFALGAYYYINPKLRASGHFTRSILRVYNGCTRGGLTCLLPYHLTFAIGYEL